MKRKLTCTTPYGVVSRTTARTYTHCVVALLVDGPHALAWCGNAERAQKEFRTWASGKRLKWRFPLTGSWEVSIFPVDGGNTQ